MERIFLKYGIALLLLTGIISCDEYVRREVEENIFVNITSLDTFVGEEIQLIASPTQNTNKYSWRSENTDVATVSNNGLVKIVGEGFTHVIVSNGTVETKVPVTAVEKIALEEVILSDTFLEMFPGATKSILVTFVPENANDIPVDSWKSENEEIVTVNANGEIAVLGVGVVDVIYTIGDIQKTIKIDAAYTRPFKGPHVLSGEKPYELPAANFDLGGEGYAFHDNDATNRTGNDNYRKNNGDTMSTPVEVEGNGTNIGYTNADEWLVYTVDVSEAGKYQVDISLSARYNTGKMHLQLNDVNVTGTVDIPSNNSWNAWKWFSHPSLILDMPAGRHRVKFYFEGSGFNLRALRFTKI